ncbi:class I SAM-dependent methyltransferase [Patescibacteria group bacterium]|nr:class I SAM-dependent methyltransferase [Patescibacteria group bacterium]
MSKGLNIQKCDLFTENIPFEDGKFDFIYCRHVIEHLPTNIQIKLFAEISRLLKKD